MVVTRPVAWKTWALTASASSERDIGCTGLYGEGLLSRARRRRLFGRRTWFD